MMKAVVEGMAPCAEPKTGSVELADACKKILPIVGENLLLSEHSCASLCTICARAVWIYYTLKLWHNCCILCA
jgi:hypothetical protein